MLRHEQPSSLVFPASHTHPTFQNPPPASLETRRLGGEVRANPILAIRSLTVSRCTTGIANLRFARTVVREEEESLSLDLNASPVSSTSYNGGNLTEIPSQESRQIHAIYSESPRLRGESPSPYGIRVCCEDQIDEASCFAMYAVFIASYASSTFFDSADPTFLGRFPLTVLAWSFTRKS